MTEHTRETKIRCFYQLDTPYHCESVKGQSYLFQADCKYTGGYFIDSYHVVWFEIEDSKGQVFVTENAPQNCIDEFGLPYELIDLTSVEHLAKPMADALVSLAQEKGWSFEHVAKIINNPTSLTSLLATAFAVNDTIRS